MTDFTTADLARINAAIAQGTLTIRHGETLVHYRSVEDLIAARDLIQSSLAGQPRRTVAKFSRGYPRNWGGQ